MKIMITSRNGNAFRITGPLCGESINGRRIPSQTASNTESVYVLYHVLLFPMSFLYKNLFIVCNRPEIKFIILDPLYLI